MKLQHRHDRAAATRSAAPAMLPQFKKEAQEELIEERLKLQEAKRHRHRDHRRRGQAHHEGHRRAQQDDGGAVRAARQGHRRRHLDHARAVPGADGLARGRPAAVRPRRSPSPSATSTACSPLGQRGRRGHGRAAGAEDHAADARPSDQTAHGQALSPRPMPCDASSAAARPWPAWPRTPATPSFEDLKFIKPSSHSRADAIACCSAPRTANAAAGHRGRRHRDLCRLRPAAIKADEKQREKAQEELRQKEFEIAGQAPPARSQAGCAHRVPLSACDDRSRAHPCRPLDFRPRHAGCGDDGRSGRHRPRYRAGELADSARSTRLPPFVLYGDPDVLDARARALGLAVPHRRDYQPCRGDGGVCRRPAGLAVPVGAGQRRCGRRRRDRGGDRGRGRGRCAGAGDEPHRQAARCDWRSLAYPGHTEFLAELAARHRRGAAGPGPVMMLAADELKVVPTTVHIPLVGGAGRAHARADRRDRAHHRGGAGRGFRHRPARASPSPGSTRMPAKAA